MGFARAQGGASSGFSRAQGTGIGFAPAQGAGGTFTPASISGLQLWLDASDLTTLWQDSARTTAVASDADPVGAWDDKSGNGRNVTQATAGSRPAYKTAILNSKPVVRFDGTDDCLRGVVNSAGIAITGGLTAFFVFRWDVAGSYFAVASYQTNAATINAWEVRTNNVTPNALSFVHASGAALQTYDSAAGPTEVAGTFALYTVKRDSALAFYKNDGASSGGGATTLTPTADASSELFIGARASGGTPSVFLDGDVAEAVVYSAALSDANRELVRDYLNAKWAVY